MLSDINEQNTPFLDCKHKHMYDENRAPPDKFRVLYRLLPIEFHGFTSRIDSWGYLSLVPGLISIFFIGGKKLDSFSLRVGEGGR